MNERIIQKFINSEGDLIELPYPPFKEWDTRQQQVHFALMHAGFIYQVPILHSNYIAFYYGYFHHVVEFAHFFSSYWIYGGKRLCDPADFNVIDKKFIEWIKIMELECFIT